MNINLLSPKQKMYALAVICFTAIAILMLMQGEAQDKADIVATVAPLEAKALVLVNEKNTLTVAPAEVALNTQDGFCKGNPYHRDCGEKKIPEQILADKGVNKTEVWKVDDVNSPTPGIPLNERIIDYEIVEISQRPERFPQAGEQITLPMLYGKKVVVEVQSIATSPNGDQTWSGHLQGQGTDYPVIVTYGEHAVFATITTPEGSYTMESVDGLGWLYKNPSEFELSDTNANDFLEVNEIL
ncbi:MAG: hypothetical protein V4660_04400 [Pseudomonadota bacterium]